MKNLEKTSAELQAEVNILRARLAESENFRQRYTEADKLRRDLEESERKYRSIVESFHGIAFRGDRNFIPEFFHGSVEQITGYTRKDFLDLKVKWDSLIHPEDLQQVLASAEEMASRSQNHLQREYRILHKNGTIRWVREHIRTVRDETGNLSRVEGVIYDITESKLSEQALKLVEERLDLAISGSKAGLWEVEYDFTDSGMPVPRKVFASPEMKRLIGFNDDEFPDSVEAWQARIVPEDLLLIEEATRSILAGRTDNHDLDYRIRHKDGGIRWIHSCGKCWRDESGRPVRQAGLDWDITERKAIEDQLRQLVAIVEETPDLVGTADLQGRVLYFNKSAKHTLGVSPDEYLPNRNITQFYPKWALQIICNQAIPIALKETVWRGETAVLKGDGRTEIPVSQVILAHADSRNNIRYMSTVIRDISRIKETEDALRKSEERYRHLSEKLEAMVKEQVDKLREAENLAAVGRTISMLAHEIRNPLNNITLGLDILRLQLKPGGEHEETLGEIRHGIEILNQLIEELLDFSKPIHLTYARRSVEALAKEALRLILDTLGLGLVKNLQKPLIFWGFDFPEVEM
ncbi:MAG: PAS domain S-box protein [Candidatus Abyssobacteria bacterium SURF_5]|uniref:histidine kinase n=1 Tax=Abyssobacteria bacterium (strain SURF_5) TaxID=2093360 RepID=A0A3A4NY87_ABYX5|nr:MAG: PAS domain S-box protein [Candidatus Abyssubacteria bacterium SURF_5]